MITTIKGIFRDRIFHGILISGLIILAIPSVSTFSMRQVPELAITLSLSFTSFIMLLLTVFLGGTMLWKDVERRYTFSTLSLPISRASYVIGKFLGVVAFMLLCAFFLSIVSSVVVKIVSMSFQPDRPLSWGNIWLAIAYDALKYILLTSFTFLFSTFSTSLFLPIFGTIVLFFVGSASQEVYEFVNSPSAHSVSPFLKQTTSLLYYIIPNFSAFDLKIYAIYSLDIPVKGLLVTLFYGLICLSVTLSLSIVVFSNREMR